MQIRSAEIEKAKMANPIKEVVEGYGIKINREGFCQCPFHNGDNTPSMKIYSNGTFYCFGCNESGDVIKFTQKMNKCTFLTALKLLGVDTESQLSWTEERRLKREQTERQKLQYKIKLCKGVIADLNDEISAQDRQIRACTMSEEGFYPFNEMEAVQAENERMRLLARRSNAEELLKQYEDEYEQRYRRT